MLLAVTHTAFELATILNFVVVIMYWSLIHNAVIEQFEGLAWFHMFVVHIFPAGSTLVNFYLTDIALVTSHWKGFVPVAVVYTAVNFY